MPRAIAPLALSFLLLLSAPLVVRADVVQDRAALYAAYHTRLDELAKWCTADGQAEAAQTIEAWLPERKPDQLVLFLPPASLAEKPADDDTPPADWNKRWQALRDAQADALMKLARQAVDEHRSSLAYELVVEALRENPAHERAREMLGYSRFRGAWHTPFEIRQLRSGKVWHERFGWLPQKHVERYESGERFALGRWMTADEETQLRGDLKRGWQVETEHYVVTTNHSLEEGVRLARRLEAFYDVWQQVFVPYLMTERDLERRFAGRAPRTIARQHKVVYFRTRDEYNAALRPAQPRIDITLGIYFDTTRTAYFFAGQEQQPSTLYHEATHQLFHETRPVAPRVARDANFWIVEGIACYMESLTPREGCFTLGGANAGRMPAARHRLLVDHFYVPLDGLVRLGMDALQRQDNIAMLYSQSAGLADFLMHADGGRYRDPLARYLGAVYAGRATPATLAELSGTAYAELDREYRAFMSAGEVGEPAEQAAR